MSSSELIFVTGASGFLGSHVVLQLLEKGYRVRASARGNKADNLKDKYSSYGDRFEVVKIADIAHDQFPAAMRGVNALIHIASPLPGRANPEELLKAAEEGTLNVIRQAEKAGVRRVVVTSSIATVNNPNESYTDQDWNPVSREMALKGDNEMLTYAASKKFAEVALWEWADKHPHVDITTLNPPFFYGPFAQYYPIPDFNALSTDLLLYNLLFPDGVPPSKSRYIDVRDVAQAHVRALNSPSTSVVGRKRILFSSPYGWPIEDIIEYIAEKRPALKDRLIKTTPEPQPFYVLPIDFTRIQQVLGMKTCDFHRIEDTLLDTVDALLNVEDQWRSAGHTIKTPPSF